MQNLPHHYKVSATAAGTTNVTLSSEGLTPIESAASAEFGGPGDRWSPETLLVAAVADCFILTFKAISRGSKIEWLNISCDVDGILDRVEKTTLFTQLSLRTVVTVPAGADQEKVQRVLEKSEQQCLITNSMTSTVTLETDIQFGA